MSSKWNKSPADKHHFCLFLYMKRPHHHKTLHGSVQCNFSIIYPQYLTVKGYLCTMSFFKDQKWLSRGITTHSGIIYHITYPADRGNWYCWGSNMSTESKDCNQMKDNFVRFLEDKFNWNERKVSLHFLSLHEATDLSSVFHTAHSLDKVRHS